MKYWSISKEALVQLTKFSVIEDYLYQQGFILDWPIRKDERASTSHYVIYSQPELSELVSKNCHIFYKSVWC